MESQEASLTISQGEVRMLNEILHSPVSRLHDRRRHRPEPFEQAAATMCLLAEPPSHSHPLRESRQVFDQVHPAMTSSYVHRQAASTSNERCHSFASVAEYGENPKVSTLYDYQEQYRQPMYAERTNPSSSPRSTSFRTGMIHNRCNGCFRACKLRHPLLGLLSTNKRLSRNNYLFSTATGNFILRQCTALYLQAMFIHLMGNHGLRRHCNIPCLWAATHHTISTSPLSCHQRHTKNDIQLRRSSIMPSTATASPHYEGASPDQQSPTEDNTKKPPRTCNAQKKDAREKTVARGFALPMVAENAAPTKVAKRSCGEECIACTILSLQILSATRFAQPNL
ncbi:hypothetical protein ACHHYP_20486 [Achlya hypogyna]|uniref:Uncharacterized protein n=1 Tax=Achlya hypogyna TaxID=1202772 RepID=A0A1V9YL27_ACHHY|nr:hypothetical protein ACHHYP_20486 [Achlya hypogyna]